MSYLLELLQTFDDKEINTFKNLDLIGKEELIRDEYARHFHSKNFEEQQLILKHKISKKHFEKITSVLLDKTLIKLYNNDIEVSLASLLRKGLSKLALHELKIQERKKINQSNHNQLQKFYKTAFLITCKMYHPNFDKKAAEYYGKKHIALLGNKADIDEIIFTELYIHVTTMIAECLNGNEEGYRTKAFALFKKWEKKLKTENSVFAHFFYYFSYAFYFKFFGTEVAPFNDALEKSLHYLQFCKPDVQKEYEFKILCELGFGKIETGDYDAAYISYTKAFETISDPATINYYNKSCLLNICLIVGKTTEAKRVFDQLLRASLNKGVNKSLQFDILVNGLTLFLYIKDFDEAFSFLTEIKSYKKNEIANSAQLLLRICETLYFYCSGDYKLAETLALRNIKFVTRPENINEQFSHYKPLFYCIAAYAKTHAAGEKITEKQINLKKGLRGGMFAVFNNLI